MAVAVVEMVMMVALVVVVGLMIVVMTTVMMIITQHRFTMFHTTLRYGKSLTHLI